MMLAPLSFHGRQSLQIVIHLLIGYMVLSLLILCVIVYVTHPGIRRSIGALAAGLSVGLSLPPLLSLAEAQGWWRCPFLNKPNVWMIVVGGATLAYAWCALGGWPIERRFGWRGLAWALAGITIKPAPRSYIE